MDRPVPLRPKPAAIITSAKKDESYIKLVKNDVDDLFQYFFGIRNWIHYRNGLTMLSRFAYYSLTTLSGLQSLGEEYTNIVMIDGEQLRVPSFKRRLLLVALQSCGQILFEQSLNHLMEILDTPNVNLWPKQLNDPRIKSRAYDAIPHVKLISSHVVKLNTALFFLGSPFYSLLNRLLAVNYTALRKWNGDATSAWLYKLIGYTSLIQLILTISAQYYGSLLSRLNESGEPADQSVARACSPDRSAETGAECSATDFDSKCSLCLYARRNATATMCGHLFCWKCIHDWLQVKDECPICRQKVKHSRLIYLQNHE